MDFFLSVAAFEASSAVASYAERRRALPGLPYFVPSAGVGRASHGTETVETVETWRGMMETAEGKRCGVEKMRV